MKKLDKKEFSEAVAKNTYEMSATAGKDTATVFFYVNGKKIPLSLASDADVIILSRMIFYSFGRVRRTFERKRFASCIF